MLSSITHGQANFKESETSGTAQRFQIFIKDNTRYTKTYYCVTWPAIMVVILHELLPRSLWYDSNDNDENYDVNNKNFKLFSQLLFINPEIYEDVVADRSISGLCGYPLCSNVFKDKFGNRTYIIVKNTVYDITVRRVSHLNNWTLGYNYAF